MMSSLPKPISYPKPRIRIPCGTFFKASQNGTLTIHKRGDPHAWNYIRNFSDRDGATGGTFTKKPLLRESKEIPLALAIELMEKLGYIVEGKEETLWKEFGMNNKTGKFTRTITIKFPITLKDGIDVDAVSLVHLDQVMSAAVCNNSVPNWATIKDERVNTYHSLAEQICKINRPYRPYIRIEGGTLAINSNGSVVTGMGNPAYPSYDYIYQDSSEWWEKVLEASHTEIVHVFNNLEQLLANRPTIIRP